MAPVTDSCASLSSPRTWGCFHGRRRRLDCEMVFPTHVGVFPHRPPLGALGWSLPHARGGVSSRMDFLHKASTSSPRTWGCFQRQLAPALGYEVFPTHVGVFLLVARGACTSSRLPHARGGVSLSVKDAGTTQESSPRTWGCFHLNGVGHPVDLVFPTHVGVFLNWRDNPWFPSGLPHARGGVSAVAPLAHRVQQSSPRTWGCFSL